MSSTTIKCLDNTEPKRVIDSSYKYGTAAIHTGVAALYGLVIVGVTIGCMVRKDCSFTKGALTANGVGVGLLSAGALVLYLMSLRDEVAEKTVCFKPKPIASLMGKDEPTDFDKKNEKERNCPVDYIAPREVNCVVGLFTSTGMIAGVGLLMTLAMSMVIKMPKNGVTVVPTSQNGLVLLGVGAALSLAVGGVTLANLQKISKTPDEADEDEDPVMCTQVEIKTPK